MDKGIYSLLRNNIQDKFGKKVLYGKDCVQLSKKINLETHRQISHSTIKRFFEIIKSDFNPSKYTLETFVIFLGFNDWNEYLDFYYESDPSIHKKNNWMELKNKVQLITENSLYSLKQKTGYLSEKLIFRKFAENRIHNFLESEKTANLFIAPEGYGKSTLIIQFVEHYFINENAPYKNDIAALIDGGIFFNLYSKNSNNELLNQILEYHVNTSPTLYFNKNPEKREGRIWVIIDNVDEIFFEQDRYHHLVENLMRIIMANDNGWYKIILTCRPENLDIFIHLIEKTPLLKSFFFELEYSKTNLFESTNIPLLQTNEIDEILQTNRVKKRFRELCKTRHDLLEIISYPKILQLFLEEVSRNKKSISELDLLNRFVENSIHSLPYREEKISIIDRFIELCEWGKISNSVKKKELLVNTRCILAYRELVSSGIIYEYIAPAGLLENITYVKFTRNVIFEFFIFEKWRIENLVNSELFFEIRKFYKNNTGLQSNILKFYTRFLLHQNNLKSLKQLYLEIGKIFSEINSQTQLTPCIRSVLSVINEYAEANKNFQKKLTTWFPDSKTANLLYFVEN